MSLCRIATAASTIVVAIALAIIVPVAQLHTVSNTTECCCPDPDRCQCPDHKPDDATAPMMKACHKTSQDVVAPVLPAFVAPAVEVASAPREIAVAAVFPLAAPHPAPALQRPRGPS